MEGDVPAFPDDENRGLTKGQYMFINVLQGLISGGKFSTYSPEFREVLVNRAKEITDEALKLYL